MFSRDLALNVNKPEQRRLLEDVTPDDAVPLIHNPWKTVRDLTLVASVGTPIPVPQLRAVLQKAHRLNSLSLFSLSLRGTPQDFQDWANVLHVHQHLKEVHFVDCCVVPVTTRRSGSMPQDENEDETEVEEEEEDDDISALSLTDMDMTDEDLEDMESANSPVISASSSQRCMMDCILVALSTIPTLENVEIYGVPTDQGGVDDASDMSTTDEEESAADFFPIMADRVVPAVAASQNSQDSPLGLTISRHSSSSRRRRIPSSPNGGMRMSPSAIATLCAASPSLRSLSLEDFDLNDEHVALMSLALTTNQTLQDLKLWGCNISDRGSAALAQMLLVNGALRKLDLSNNEIHDDGCVAIAAALRHHPTMRWLSLAGNDCVIRYPPSSRNNGAPPPVASIGGNSRGLGFEALRQMLMDNPVLENLILDEHERDSSFQACLEVIAGPAPE